MSNKKKAQNPKYVQIQKEFKPRTINQNTYVRSMIENDVTFCTGVAGTGKTSCSVGLGCSWLAEGKITRIVITRPIVETSKKGLGFLPGNLLEKVHPYLIPILDEMNIYFHQFDVENMLSKGIVDVVPLEYMRGRNFHDTFMILDEAQNASYDQLKMFLTRIGKNTKAVINGDVRQSDLHLDVNPLSICMDKLEGVEGVGIVRLGPEDIQRSGIISRILARLD